MTDTRTARAAGGQADLERARRGHRQAFTTLYEQHALHTWRLALVAGRDPVAAEAAVVGAFAHVLGNADGSDLLRFAPVDVQLLRATRASAVEQAARIGAPAGLEAIATAWHIDTVRAFDRLPERWRSVLWLDQIERIGGSTIAAVLGATEQSTTGLSERALGGLREQLAQLQVHDHMPADCRATTLRLGGYAARALPSRETIRARQHLDGCEDCRTRLDQLDDVTPRLRRALPPLPLGLEDLAFGAWLARAHATAGPIGLRMPGGTLAPAWLERSLAGATAAVVSLGITAAIALGARNGGNPTPIESASPAEADPIAQADDSTDDAETDDGATVVSVSPSVSSYEAGAGSSNGSSSDGGDAGAPLVSPTPRGGTTTPPGGSSGSPSPGPAPSPTPTPSPNDPSDPSGPSSTDPVGDVVDDVVDEVCGVLTPVCDSLPVAAPEVSGLL